LGRPLTARSVPNEPAVPVDPEVLDRQHEVRVERPLVGVAVDDQDAGEPAAELLHGVAMRMEEERAAIHDIELVGPALARAHRRLGDERHAVDGVGNAQPVPVDGRVLAQPVHQRRAQPVALADPDDRHAGRVVGPERQGRRAPAQHRRRPLGRDQREVVRSRRARPNGPRHGRRRA
jgi:hypothetical protein